MTATTHPPVTPPAPAESASPTRSLAMERLLRRMERLLGLIFIAVVLLNFASAAGRYAGGRPIMGADEVQVFTMVWLIFLGTIFAAVRRIHLRMDVLTANLSGPKAKWRAIAELMLTTAVCAAMAWISLQFTMEIYGLEQKSDAAEIPMWIPHLSAVIGFAGMTLSALVELVSVLGQPGTPTERHLG